MQGRVRLECTYFESLYIVVVLIFTDQCCVVMTACTVRINYNAPKFHITQMKTTTTNVYSQLYCESEREIKEVIPFLFISFKR